MPGGPPGERGFLLVPVMGVEPFLGLTRQKNHFVAAEERHERGPVLRICRHPCSTFSGLRKTRAGRVVASFSATLASHPPSDLR